MVTNKLKKIGKVSYSDEKAVGAATRQLRISRIKYITSAYVWWTTVPVEGTYEEKWQEYHSRKQKISINVKILKKQENCD